MADTDVLRQEINQAISIIDPQIRGMVDLKKVSLAPSTIEAVNLELADRERRRVLLGNVITALDSVNTTMEALIADGYPILPKGEVTNQIFLELKEQLADFDAAVKEFEEARAAEIKIEFGEPILKP